jgi:AraC-like DNA-binding protein
MNRTRGVSDDSSPVRETWSLPGPPGGGALADTTAPYSRVEFVFDRGAGYRARCGGEPPGQMRPPTFVYSQCVGALRLDGHCGTLVIGFRVSPIVVSTLLSRPPAEIWNEPVALPDLLDQESGISNCDVQCLFNHALQNAPLEHLDMMSNQLGWSPSGLRRLFAKSTTLSAQDVQLIGRRLDACAPSRALSDQDAEAQAGLYRQPVARQR